MIITVIVGFGFMTTFSNRLYVGCFVKVSNFGVIIHNKIEKGDWRFVLRVEITTIIEPIDPCFINLKIVYIH
jgi:hypothetical protein